MLTLSNVVISYGRINAVKGLSLSVSSGEIVALLGANGAGKTTTLCSIAGLLKPDSGSIKFEGRELAGCEPEETVRLGVSLVPEGRKIFGRLTVRENLEMGGYSKPQDMISGSLDRIFELFPVLRERQKQPGGTLSGGEQQMLAIGRSLMSGPKMLLLDEPSLGLSPIMEQSVFSIISGLKKSGTTILLVEQNANLALKISDRAYVMENGEIKLEGGSKELLLNEEVRKAYLGE